MRQQGIKWFARRARGLLSRVAAASRCDMCHSCAAGVQGESGQPASDMSVLSVCRGLTVWCRSGMVSLTSPEGDRGRWDYADLVEAAEQTVRCYEELELGLDLAAAGA